MLIEICVGSSCHLKGSHALVERFQEEIVKRKSNTEITLSGCFCTGKCNREGVTVVIDGVTHTGVTTENFDGFFRDHVLNEPEK